MYTTRAYHTSRPSHTGPYCTELIVVFLPLQIIVCPLEASSFRVLFVSHSPSCLVVAFIARSRFHLAPCGIFILSLRVAPPVVVALAFYQINAVPTHSERQQIPYAMVGFDDWKGNACHAYSRFGREAAQK
jgi:hypothetical protein